MLALLAALDSGTAPLALWSLGSRKEPRLACDSFSAAVAWPWHTRTMRSCSAMLSPRFAAAAACKPRQSSCATWAAGIQAAAQYTFAALPKHACVMRSCSPAAPALHAADNACKHDGYVFHMAHLPPELCLGVVHERFHAHGRLGCTTG
jgi:hypothetical protein